MGWTWANWSSNKEALEDELSGMKIVDHSIKGNTGFAAVETKDGKIFGLVAMFKRDSDGIGIKLIDESMGPAQIDCPKRILNKLTPLDELYAADQGEYARDWRAACHAFHNRPKPPKLKEGMTVRFPEPLDFGPFEEQEFIVQKLDGRLYFEARNGRKCRILGYTKMMYEVVE